MESTEHNHTSFADFPLPELRVNRARTELCGASVIKGLQKSGEIIHLRLLSSKGTDRDDSFEIVGTEKHMRRISEMLSRQFPSMAVQGSSPHATVSETHTGNLMLCLKEAGRKLLEGDNGADILVQPYGSGLEVNITYKRIHPSLLPPFITCGDRLWYHRPSQHGGTKAFTEQILRDGWAEMTLYEPI